MGHTVFERLCLGWTLEKGTVERERHVWSVDANAHGEYENEVSIKHVISFTGNSETWWEEKLCEKSVDSTWPTKATYAEA